MEIKQFDAGFVGRFQSEIESSTLLRFERFEPSKFTLRTHQHVVLLRYRFVVFIGALHRHHRPLQTLDLLTSLVDSISEGRQKQFLLLQE